MRRTFFLTVAAILLAGAVWGAARATYDDNYARDRAEIDDLLARYLFALDWQDPQMYGSIFTEDGVLVWAGGTVNGRAAIVKEMKSTARSYLAIVSSLFSYPGPQGRVKSAVTPCSSGTGRSCRSPSGCAEGPRHRP